MRHQLKIQDSQKQELEQILELQRRCYQSEAALYNDYTIQPLVQTFEELTREFDKGIFLSGYVGTQLAASVRGNVSDKTGFINKLIVDPAFQNNGFGRAMMNAIEKKLNNCDRLELFTGDKSVKNISLYQKLGFVIYDRKRVSDTLILVYFQKFNKVN